MMRLTRVELHELALPLSEPFIISGGTMTVRRSLVVVIHDEAGHVGYGESPRSSCPSTPRKPSAPRATCSSASSSRASSIVK